MRVCMYTRRERLGQALEMGGRIENGRRSVNDMEVARETTFVVGLFTTSS